MATRILKALLGKLDIKRHSPSILYISTSLAMSTSVLKALHGKFDIKRRLPSRGDGGKMIHCFKIFFPAFMTGYILLLLDV